MSRKGSPRNFTYAPLYLVRCGKGPFSFQGTYDVDDMKFNLDSMSAFLNQEYVGEYGCELKTTQKADTTSCHRVKLAIMEADQ